MASWVKKQAVPAEKHVTDQHFAITEIEFHCVAVLPYYWSSWTVYVQQWDWLKGFLLLGTNYDRAWFLWPKLAASSNTVSEKWRQQRFNRRFALHFRADSHHDKEICKRKIIMYFTVFCFFYLTVEHIANVCQQVCMACRLKYHRCTVTQRLTGVQR